MQKVSKICGLCHQTHNLRECGRFMKRKKNTTKTPYLGPIRKIDIDGYSSTSILITCFSTGRRLYIQEKRDTLGYNMIGGKRESIGNPSRLEFPEETIIREYKEETKEDLPFSLKDTFWSGSYKSVVHLISVKEEYAVNGNLRWLEDNHPEIQLYTVDIIDLLKRSM